MVKDDSKIVDLAAYRKVVRNDKKRNQRQEKEKTAASNRLRFGRSKLEKKRLSMEEERRLRELNGKQRGSEPPRAKPTTGVSETDKPKN